MGTGLGPSWFSPEFPAVAARRDPFPDVNRWQTTYVRYSLSEVAQTKGWDAESCRRNLYSLGLSEHPLVHQATLPEAINMRIIEAPAEFALPVKQDRRLLPCFKVRLEVQHRGALSLPLTLRAHVLSQQDKEQISSWMPPDDNTGRDDKGQKAATELKGTAFIRCTLEACAGGEIKTVGLGGKDGQSLQQTGANSGAGRNGSSSDRLIKAEPMYGMQGSLGYGNGSLLGGVGCTGIIIGNGPSGGGAGLGALPGQRGASLLGPGSQPDVIDAFGMSETCTALSGPAGGSVATGLLRDIAGGAPGLPQRDVSLGLNSLFAANRCEPVVTLASSGRLSGTGSNLSSLASAQTPGGAPVGLGGSSGNASTAALLGAGGGLLLSQPGDTRDPFEAAVEMVMQPSQQPRRPSPLHGLLDGGSRLLSDMQRQIQIQQQQQMEEHGGRVSQERPGSMSTPSGVNRVHMSCQDFEFTNLEFLKPTRMNKVYMAFVASILDTDLLYVVFNVPTIGICRAEQREKACKKLHIDYKLLSHFDQSSDRPAAAAAATAAAAPSSPALSSLGGGDGGGGGRDGCGGRSGAQEAMSMNSTGKGSMSMAQLCQQTGKPLQLPTQQQQQQPGGGGGLQDVTFGAQDVEFAQHGLNVIGLHGMKYGSGLADGKSPQLQVSDTDYPRLMAANFSLQHQHQHQQHHQQEMHQQHRMLGPDGGFQSTAGVSFRPAGLATAAAARGGLLGMSSLLSASASGLVNAGGMVMPGAGMQSAVMMGGARGMGQVGVLNNEPIGVARMLQAGMAFGMGSGMGGDPSNAGSDFFFGAAVGGGMQNNGSVQNGAGLNRGGLGPGAGCGMGTGGLVDMELGSMGMGGNSRKRDQGLKEDDNYRFQPVQPAELPPYQGFMGLTSSDVEMLLPAPHSRMAMRDFITEVYEGTGLHRKLTHMDMQALLSQAGFPMDSNREHDTISPQQWDEFCVQFRNIVNTLQQVASVWNMEDPVVISGFDMDRAGTITALADEPAGTFICRFSMSQPGCLVLTCKVGTVHPRADPMGLIHAIIKIDDLHERRVDTWIRDYAGATHLLDVYRQKRIDKRKVFATNYTRLRGLEVGEQHTLGPMGTGGFM